MNKNKKNSNILRIIIVAIIIIVISLVAGIFISKLLPNFHKEDFRSYFGYYDDIVTVQDDRYKSETVSPMFNNTDLYISIDYVKENIDKFIYWDENLSKLTITNENEVIRFKADDTEYFINGEEFNVDLPVKIFNSEPYIPASLIESLYNYDIQYFSDTDIVVVHDLSKEERYTTIKNGATLRYEPNRKGVIEDKLKKGEKVQIFDQYDNFTKVVTENGKVGYIKTNELSKNIETVAPINVEEKEIYQTPEIDGEITIVWDMITNVDANSTVQARTNLGDIDVLSPTWFKFDRDKLDGTIISYCDKDYVDWAHNQGYMVWGLLSDVADAYDDVVLHNVLNNSDYREYAIKQLLMYMQIYDLDGLNIDFEVLRPEDSDEYVQFFRELYPYMKKEGKYLSVDTYVPQEWSQYFRRADVAESVDYFIIMGYDEHNPSTEPGPVASYNFVEEGIVDTIAEGVPKEKLILGVPFYTRIWKEQTIDGVTKGSYYRDMGMEYAIERFEENDATYSFDSDSGYMIAEYTVVEDGNTVTYKSWIETDDTIEDKALLAKKYGLKGVAGWRRGLEGDSTIDLINRTIK